MDVECQLIELFRLFMTTMLNNSSHSGYYDMDNRQLIGENSSEVDALNSTPFSVRDILNIDQTSEGSSYQTAMNSSDLYAQKYYANNVTQFNNAGQYKR